MTKIILPIFLISLNAYSNNSIPKQTAIEKLNNEAKAAITNMKKRWELKKEIACSFVIGTKKVDIEKLVGYPIIENGIVEPTDEFYRSQVKPLKMKFVDGRLSKIDKACYSLRGQKKNKVQEKGFNEAYGETFNLLSEGEKKYITDSQEIMRRITQQQLNRLRPVNIPRDLNVNASNIVEFYLYPNGDISGLRIIIDSGYDILDDTSKQTIEYSYHRYPLPKQKTLIRYKVGYYLDSKTSNKKEAKINP